MDITCGEMAMCTNLLQGHAAEWALLRRHPCEDIFGIQVCGGYSDSVSRCAQLLEDEVVSKGGIDFVDINMVGLVVSPGKKGGTGGNRRYLILSYNTLLYWLLERHMLSLSTLVDDATSEPRKSDFAGQHKELKYQEKPSLIFFASIWCVHYAF